MKETVHFMRRHECSVMLLLVLLFDWMERWHVRKVIHQHLLDVWRKKASSYSTVKSGIKKFKEQDHNIDVLLLNERKSGRLRSSTTNEDIEIVRDKEDLKSSLRTLTRKTTAAISHKTVHQWAWISKSLLDMDSASIKLSDASNGFRVNYAKELRYVLSEMGDDA